MGASSCRALQDERYLLLEALGRGGMGAVYRAYDRAEQRLVALKVLSDADLAGPGHPLAAEFEIWSRMRHPNIVEAYELGLARSGPIAGGTPYLVLEHVTGGPAHRVFRPGRLNPQEADAVAEQLLRALAHVHASGFIHRDLKPANILVQRNGRPARRLKLTDFGLASRVGLSRRIGCFSGSLPYASPEALLGLPLDGRADLYGLGILLYQLVTGELPFPKGGFREILRWHVAGSPADPSRLRPRFPGRISRFIRRLTARDRDERPRSAAQALRMIGVGPTCAAREPRAAVGRATRAGLRLALDAVRLGASRVFRLPASRAASATLVREVSVRAQVRGLSFLHLPRGLADGLGRLVVRLLLDRGSEAVACVRRHGLDRSLPIELIGGVPILDPSRTTGGRARLRSDARGIREFLLDCAAVRPTVLCIERPARSEPLVRELCRELVEAIDGVLPSRGGLLLLVDEEAVDGVERLSDR